MNQRKPLRYRWVRLNTEWRVAEEVDGSWKVIGFAPEFAITEFDLTEMQAVVVEMGPIIEPPKDAQ